MDKLAWTMEDFRIGSPEQIIWTVCLVVAGILFGILFAKSKIRTGWVLLVSGILLIASEVLKQFFLYHILGGYPWSDFPFQLCSIPMYFCILYFFFPKRWMAQFTMIYSLIGAAASFIVPSAVISLYVLMTVHSLFWHTMLLFIGVFLMVRQTKEDMKPVNYIPVAITYLILAGIAVALNAAFYRVSGGTMNMFFLGPGWPDMYILNDIYMNSGWIPATLGMIGVSEGVGLGLYLLIWLFKKNR